MTAAAVSTGTTVLAWIGLALGVVVLLLVILLFRRILTPAQEIRRYADDILEAGLQIAKNLDGVDELARTRELATAVPSLATAYLKKLGAA
jgi:hypothetical protein